MRKRKILSLFIATIMLLSIFLSGCVNVQKSGENSLPAGNEEKKTEDSNLEGNLYKTGLPIVKDKISIRIAFSPHSANRTPFENMEITKVLEERTNIHIEFEQIPSGQGSEKLNIMVASGDLPDALMRIVSNDVLINNYDAGLFLPLNDLIDKWAPNIKKMIADPMVKSQLTLPDGKIYSTPAGELAPWSQVSQYLYVNKIWLDNLGLDLPKTTEEYMNVLKAVKEKDADGDGKTDDEIPLSMVGVDNFRTLLGAFGIACESDYIYIRNGKVGYAAATENFRKALEYFHELYAEGLIDSKSFAQDIQQLYAKAKSGDLFSFNQFLNTTVAGPELGPNFQHLLPLIGPDGNQEYSQTILGVSHGLVLSAKTKYADAIIRWVDYLNTDTTTMLEVCAGLESQGVWTNLGNGRYLQNSNKVPEGLNWIEWFVNTAWSTTSAPVYLGPDFIAKNRSLEGDEITANALKRALEVLEFKLDEVMPIVMIDQDISKELALINTELSLLVRNSAANFIINGIDDAQWNDYLNKLKQAKYERYVELKQNIYDSKK